MKPTEGKTLLLKSKAFRALAVAALRRHRYCGDQFPENGWQEVTEALAKYALERRQDRKARGAQP